MCCSPWLAGGNLKQENTILPPELFFHVRLSSAMTDSQEKSAFDVLLADTDIEIPKLLRPTLDRLDVKTLGQLALLDEYAASKAWGVEQENCR